MTALISREVMGETMPRSQQPRKRACDLRPHHASRVAVELGKMLGLSPKTVERKLAEFRGMLDRLPEAARLAESPTWLANFAAHFDAARAIDTAPLTCDSAFACLISRDVLAEQQSLTEFAADQSREHCAGLLTKSVKLRHEVAELIAALEHRIGEAS